MNTIVPLCLILKFLVIKSVLSKLIENESFTRQQIDFKKVIKQVPENIGTNSKKSDNHLNNVLAVNNSNVNNAKLSFKKINNFNKTFVQISTSDTLLPKSILNIKNKLINIVPSRQIPFRSNLPNASISRRSDTNQINRYFYTQLLNNGSDRGDTYLANKPRYYINYKKAYGIRYDPNNIKRSFKIDTEMTSNSTMYFYEPENITTNNGLIDFVTYPMDIEQETTIQSNINDSNELMEDSVDDDENVKVFENGNKNKLLSEEVQNYNGTNTNTNTNSNIMKLSRIRNVLEFFKNRLKKFFQFTDSNSEEKTTNAQNGQNGQRFLNLFNLIKFDNVPCSTSNDMLAQLNGTCYHELQCNQLNGVAIDLCANGFGVCCIFQFGCGGITQQKISYFKSDGFPAAFPSRLICTFTIELAPNVKQVLLEFLFFELKPPIDGSCTDDQFIIYGQSFNYPIPIFCGINTGQHIYVDVENAIERKLFLSVLTVTSGPRAFNIRISQLDTDLAPPNCLQYFTESSGFIKTFNYEDESKIVEFREPSYYNNLNYAICIKRRVGYCTTTYTNERYGIEFPFQLINVDEDGISVIPHDQAGAEIYNCGDDFISVNGIRLCGEKLNDASITEDFSINAPVTDYTAGPIIIPVRTNDAVVGRGFKLYYKQQPCQSI